MSDGIQFSTGEKTFVLNEKCEISFNPSSMTFAEKLLRVVTECSNQHKEFEEESGKPENKLRVYDLYRGYDQEIRKSIDEVFGTTVCSATVPDDASVLDFADGFPIWANLMLAVFDKMDESVSSIKAQANERVRKYSAKYKRK